MSTPHSHPSWAQIFAVGSCFIRYALSLYFFLNMRDNASQPFSTSNNIIVLNTLILKFFAKVKKKKKKIVWTVYKFYDFYFDGQISFHSDHYPKSEGVFLIPQRSEPKSQSTELTINMILSRASNIKKLCFQCKFNR